jgi:hypothetical protein
MTPRDHNKLLAWSHVVLGAFNASGILVGVIFILLGVSVPSSGQSGGFDSFTTLTVGWVIFFLFGGFALISFVAGSKMLKRDKSARAWALISAVIGGPNAPLGTAVCVYTFWFFLGDAGRRFYSGSLVPNDGSTRQVSQASQNALAAAGNGANEYEYAPPPRPHHWRSDD